MPQPTLTLHLDLPIDLALSAARYSSSLGVPFSTYIHALILDHMLDPSELSDREWGIIRHLANPAQQGPEPAPPPESTGAPAVPFSPCPDDCRSGEACAEGYGSASLAASHCHGCDRYEGKP